MNGDDLAVINQDIEVIAETPDEMKTANMALIEWCLSRNKHTHERSHKSRRGINFCGVVERPEQIISPATIDLALRHFYGKRGLDVPKPDFRHYVMGVCA